MRKSYDRIIGNCKSKNPSARIEGVLVQKTAEKSFEFALGGTRNSQFGPMIMFGMGGIYIELIQDASFRLAPVNFKDALEMIRETRASQVFRGIRGSPPLNVKLAVGAIKSVGEIMSENQEIRSIDINPFMIYKSGALAVDAKIVLEDKFLN